MIVIENHTTRSLISVGDEMRGLQLAEAIVLQLHHHLTVWDMERGVSMVWRPENTQTGM